MKKTVLIIGASGDIGVEISKHLSKEGYQLILHYFSNYNRIETLRGQLPEDSVLLAIQANLLDRSSIKPFLNKIVFPVDKIVFASGALEYGLFQDMNESRIYEMLTLHIEAPLLITKHFLPQFIAKGFGKLLFITSIWGAVGASLEVMYSTVKGAQNSFVKALAKEVGPSGIQVNGVSPGFIDTKMNAHLDDDEKEQIIRNIPLNRAGTPADVAGIVTFLLSEEATYIQGQIIEVNGGW